MTIQISVCIWTAICFAALYLVLRNLLFRPMLSLMDERERKISGARTARAEAERRLEEERLRRIAAREEATRRARAEAEREAEHLRLEGKRQLEEAKKAHFAYVEDCRAAAETGLREDMQNAAEPVGRAAERFLSRLFAD